MLKQVYAFNSEIRKETQPTKPQQMTIQQHHARAIFLSEECLEFAEATTPEGELDALIDIIYFAIGGMYEMGLSEKQVQEAFSKVHMANMKKVAGAKLRAAGIEVTDAAKPDNWLEPDLSVYFKCCGCGGCDGKE